MWMGAARPSNISLQATDSVTDVPNLVSLSDGIPDVSQGALVASPGILGTPASQVPLARFDEDSAPWLWAPVGATVVVGTTLGVTVAGTASVQVELEVRFSTDIQSNDITVQGTNLTASAGTSVNTFQVSTVVSSSGAWFRPKAMVVTNWGTSAIPFTASWVPTVNLGVFVNATLGAYTPGASAAFSAITWTAVATPAANLLPLLGPYSSRSSTTAFNASISQAIKTIGCALSVQNTTALLNMEGQVVCARFLEGALSLGRLPTDSDLGRLLPVDKMTARMSSGLYSYVRPGPEFNHFRDGTFDPGVVSPGSSLYYPCMRLLQSMNWHLFRFTDFGTATTSTLLLELQISMEYVTADILLRPEYARGVIHDTEAAVILCERTPLFVPRPRPVELVNEPRMTRQAVERMVASNAPKRRGRKAGKSPKDMPQAPAPKAAKKKAQKSDVKKM